MATRITIFEIKEGIRGRLGFRFADRICSSCGWHIDSVDAHICPHCMEEFTSFVHDYRERQKDGE